MGEDKYCTYCNKHDHNYSECWSTRRVNWYDTYSWDIRYINVGDCIPNFNGLNLVTSPEILEMVRRSLKRNE